MAFFPQQARRLAWSSSDKEQSVSTHSIKRLSRNAPLSSFIEAVEQDGCVIVTDFTDKIAVEQANKEVRPWLEKESDGAVVGALQGQTRTVTRLISRSETVREK